MDTTTLTHPTMDSAVRVVPLADRRVQIRTPSESLTVGRQSPLVLDLVGLCDGSRHIDDIVRQLSGRGYPGGQVREICDYLIHKGVLTHRSRDTRQDLLLTHVQHFARRAGETSDESGLCDGELTVEVVGAGQLAAAVRADLDQLGIQVVDASAEQEDLAALTIACGDYESQLAFREHNRTAVETAQPILFACIAETRIRVGPFVVPGDTACFECFHHRLRANVVFREEFDSFAAYEAALENAGIERVAGVYARLGSALVCAQAVSFLFGALQHCLFDRLVELIALSAELTTSTVLKLPRCEVCGRTGNAPPPAIRDWL